MRCKPGDLAVRIKAEAGSGIPIGSIVEIIGRSEDVWLIPQQGGLGRWGTNLWDVRFKGSNIGPKGLAWAIPDSDLRPIRDQPGEDETLTWAGMPGQLTVAKLKRAMEIVKQGEPA